MLRRNYDENAAVPTGLPPNKGVLRSDKKSHKNALGDLKNTIHNTPMGAIPKTPFHARIKPMATSPYNQIPNPSWTKNPKKSDLTDASLRKAHSKKSQSKGVRFAPEMIDYNNFLPESVYRDERSITDIWAEKNCPTHDEISKIIQDTLQHDPEHRPKFIPYEDELKMPPPSPADSLDFPFENPPMFPMDLLDVDFSQLNMNE